MKFYFSCQHNGSPSTENSVAADKSTHSVAKSPTKEQLKAMLKKYQQAAKPKGKSIDYIVNSQTLRSSVTKSSNNFENLETQSLGLSISDKKIDQVPQALDHEFLNNSRELKQSYENSDTHFLQDTPRRFCNYTPDDDKDARRDGTAKNHKYGNSTNLRASKLHNSSFTQNDSIPDIDEDEKQLFGKYYIGEEVCTFYNQLFFFYNTCTAAAIFHVCKVGLKLYVIGKHHR